MKIVSTKKTLMSINLLFSVIFFQACSCDKMEDYECKVDSSDESVFGGSANEIAEYLQNKIEQESTRVNLLLYRKDWDIIGVRIVNFSLNKNDKVSMLKGSAYVDRLSEENIFFYRRVVDCKQKINFCLQKK